VLFGNDDCCTASPTIDTAIPEISHVVPRWCRVSRAA
jgi:hypothetical protein